MVRMLRICFIAAVFCAAGNLFMPLMPIPGEAPEPGLARVPTVPFFAPGMPPRGGTVGRGNQLRRNNGVFPGGGGGVVQVHAYGGPAGRDDAVVPGGG